MNEKRFHAESRFIPYQAIPFNDCLKIPIALAQSGNVTLGELLLYGCLAHFAGKSGDCYPAIGKITKCIPISKRTIIRHIQSLVEKGFLRIVPRSEYKSSRRSNSYEFIKHPLFGESSDAPRSAKLTSSRCQTGTGTNANMASKKENRKIKNKTTTTRKESEICPRFAVQETGGCGSDLSDQEKHYIQLQVEFTAAHGDLRKPPRRLEKALVRLAAEGKLDMSDYSDLVKWKSAQAAPRQNEACFTLPDKAALHAEIEAVDREARKWLASLPHTHPANSETKPSLMTEGVWIRFLYQKYYHSEGMKDVA